MTKTITKDKTMLVLAFAATFIAGAAVFGAFSDYEAEAKPNKDPPTLPPIFKPINATLFEIQAQLDELQDDVDAVSAKQTLISADISVIDDTVNEIKTTTATTKTDVTEVLVKLGP